MTPSSFFSPTLYRKIGLILIILGFSASSFSAMSGTSNPNLLHGDSSFETGFNAWHAYSGLNKANYLANRNYRIRRDGLPQPVVSDHQATHGSHSLALSNSPGSKAYLTGRPVSLEKGTRYSFSADIRCDNPGKVFMGVIPEKSSRKKQGFSEKDFRKKLQAKSKWSRYSYHFSAAKSAPYIPVIELRGRNKCWIDGLSLNRGKIQSYSPPALLASLQVKSNFPTRMPNLLDSPLSGADNQSVPLIASLFNPGGREITILLKVVAEDPEGRVVLRLDRQIEVPANRHIQEKIDLPLPKRGVWRVQGDFLTTAASGQSLAQAELTLARLERFSGKLDPFFGTHDKLTDVGEFIGFGAIRDMHLLKWIDFMPSRGSIRMPDKGELASIRAFIANGGLYLATLVSESPAKNRWNKRRWGKRDFGHIPLWAGSAHDSTPGQSKRVFRLPTADALDTYVSTVAKKFPYLALEFMNEPNYYMSPKQYADLLKVAYQAVKGVNPDQTLVGFANPPEWGSLPGSKKRKKIPIGYRWFDKALSLGAAEYLDVLSLHLYGRHQFKETPETGYGTGEAIWAKSLADKASSMAGSRISVWNTEKGISSEGWKDEFRVNSRSTNQKAARPLTQARWLVRAQLDARAKGLEHFFIFNRPWDENILNRYLPRSDIAFTLFEVDGQPRPALGAQHTLIRMLAHSRHVKSLKLEAPLYGELFTRDNRLTAVIWSSGEDESSELKSPAFYLNCAPPVNLAEVTSLFGGNLSSVCGSNDLEITPSPLYLRFPTGMDEAEIMENLHIK